MKTASPIRALFLLLLLTAAVYGGSVTYVATPIPSTVTNWNGEFVLDKFDPSLGNLTGIIITLGSDLDGTGSLTNKATTEDGTSDTTLTLQAIITLTLPGAATLPNLVLTSRSYTLAPNSSQIGFSFPTATNTVTFSPEAANFGLYTGAGETLTIPVSAVGSWSLVSTGGEVTATASSFASAGASIEYLFGETPEPATFVLIGLPLLAIGYFARKRLAR